MLKNLGYNGAYRDENISVSILLENPMEHGLEPTDLAFSVTLISKNGEPPRMKDFAFYVMDETNRLHNTKDAPYVKHAPEPYEDDEPVCCPNGLIHTDFTHDFLFQDLRIAFYYRPYMKISLIKMKH